MELHATRTIAAMTPEERVLALLWQQHNRQLVYYLVFLAQFNYIITIYNILVIVHFILRLILYKVLVSRKSVFRSAHAEVGV